MKDLSAEEGLVAIGYERKHAERRYALAYKEQQSLFNELIRTYIYTYVHARSRMYQYIKVYLFAASSAVFDCPLSMTD